jgi:urea transport system permease protein
LDRAAVEKLAFGDGDEKIEAIGALVAEGDPKAAALLQAFSDGELQTSGKRVLLIRSNETFDAVTGAKVSPPPADREDVVANNRLRGAVASALAGFKLTSPERAERLAAAKALGGADAAILPLIRKSLEKETDPEVRALLDMIAASMELKDGSKDSRLSAIRKLASSNNKALLLEAANDPDEDIRLEAQKSLRAVEGRLAAGEWIGLAFAGVSPRSDLRSPTG